MKQNQIVQETIYKHQPNELIFANKVYSQQLDGKVSEVAYYKTLERMCKAGTLAKAAKGTYYIPKQSAFGVVPPSERAHLRRTIPARSLDTRFIINWDSQRRSQKRLRCCLLRLRHR